MRRRALAGRPAAAARLRGRAPARRREGQHPGAQERRGAQLLRLRAARGRRDARRARPGGRAEARHLPARRAGPGRRRRASSTRRRPTIRSASAIGPSSSCCTAAACGSASSSASTPTASTCRTSRCGSSARATRSAGCRWGTRRASGCIGTASVRGRRGRPGSRRRPCSSSQRGSRMTRESVWRLVKRWTRGGGGRRAGHAAHVPAQLRDPSARGWSRPARGPGAARPC